MLRTHYLLLTKNDCVLALPIPKLNYFLNIFFAFWSKFGKAKQIVVARIATTLKALLSVAKTNGRLARREFYAGNIDYFFWNTFTHITPYWHIKRCATEATHRKTQTPIVAKQSVRSIGMGYTTNRELHFFQNEFGLLCSKKRYSIPIKRKYTYGYEYSDCLAHLLYHFFGTL